MDREQHAERVSDLLVRIEDLQVEMKAALEIAKEQGVNIREMLQGPLHQPFREAARLFRDPLPLPRFL